LGHGGRAPRRLFAFEPFYRLIGVACQFSRPKKLCHRLETFNVSFQELPRLIPDIGSFHNMHLII
jgi:hypothetical protein